MVKRYELTDAQWRRIEGLLAGKPGDPGRTGKDNRLFVNAVLWVLRSGARWSDLPERYGKLEERAYALHALGQEGSLGAGVREPDRRSRQPVSDARHHPGPGSPAGGDRKRGAPDQALGRSRGGLTTKIHALTDAQGRPLRFILTGGQAHDSTTAPELLSDLEGGGVIADKAYDSNALRERIAEAEAEAVIPSTRSRKVEIPDDEVAYKLRNRIERFFNKLKHFRRIATRYERRAIHFLAAIQLASSIIWMR